MATAAMRANGIRPTRPLLPALRDLSFTPIENVTFAGN
jgi:hypothetical protein